MPKNRSPSLKKGRSLDLVMTSIETSVRWDCWANLEFTLHASLCMHGSVTGLSVGGWRPITLGGANRVRKRDSEQDGVIRYASILGSLYKGPLKWFPLSCDS